MSRSSRVHCVVVDDHVMVAQMLCGMLRTQQGLDVVATGTGVKDAARLAALKRIDLVIIDEALDDDSGLDVLRVILPSHADVRCILLTDGDASPTVPDDMADAVSAVVDKSASWEDLLTAIESAAGSRGRKRQIVPSREQLQALLTAREFDVLSALGQGSSNKEVAKMLRISVQTVETHRKAVSRKLGCNGASLVRMAAVSNLTALDPHPGS